MASPKKVARELGLAPETLRSWMRQAEEAGLVPSMRSVADAYDNALAESFVSTLKREFLHCHSWPSREGVRAAIFEYIECFYNPRRRHSSLGQMSPVDYEQARMKERPWLRGNRSVEPG